MLLLFNPQKSYCRPALRDSCASWTIPVSSMGFKQYLLQNYKFLLTLAQELAEI